MHNVKIVTWAFQKQNLLLQQMKKLVLHIVLVFWLLSVTSILAFYQPPKNPIRFSKWTAGVLLQRYYYNTFHSRDVNAGISFMTGFYQEFAVDGMKNKNFVSVGAEYLYQSFSFSSYYFTQDTMMLYNGKMDYRYHLKINELNIPLLYKHSFGRENNDVSSVYFAVGYIYRILLPSSFAVNKDGMNIKLDKFRPEFKIPVLNRYGNSYAHLSIGFQKNNPQGKMRFFVELFARYGFSPIMFKKNYSANNLYFGNYFLGFSVGMKWRR